MLLSALEAASFGISKDGGRLPDYLYDRIAEAVAMLGKEVLKWADYAPKHYQNNQHCIWANDGVAKVDGQDGEEMSTNEITGDKLVTKETTDQFRDGYDLIWGKRDASIPKPPEGYTAEELERDNPYNQWMNEDVSKS